MRTRRSEGAAFSRALDEWEGEETCRSSLTTPPRWMITVLLTAAIVWALPDHSRGQHETSCERLRGLAPWTIECECARETGSQRRMETSRVVWNGS